MEIFISYRRADSAAFTGKLYTELIKSFGEKSVFRDVNGILAGRDFQITLKNITKNCNVMLVVIAGEWTRIMKERASQPEDWVRFEVETGLERKDILVIPVLVNGAQMPNREELPVTIQDLPRRNAVLINEHETFERDIQNLIRTINEVGYKRILGTVSAGVSLHTDSDRDSQIVSRISKGTKVTLLEYNRDGSWAHILTGNNLDGWAATADFSLLTEQPTQSVKEISVTGGYGAKGSAWQLFFTSPTGKPGVRHDLGIDVRLADAITRSRSSIDIAAFEFDNKILTEAILEVKERGHRIRVVTHKEHGLDNPESTLHQLAEAGIPITASERAALMHNKFMILDGATVWTGSWNYTENSTYRNNENSIVFNDPGIAELYENKFEEMFTARKFGPTSASDEIHSMKVAGNTIEICFTPSTSIEDRIENLILSARKSIHFMMFSFTNFVFSNAMIQSHNRGVQVFGILEKMLSKMTSGELSTFLDAGLQIHLDNNPYFLHHKVVVIDEAICITGSANFSRPALESNDENMVIIHDPALAGVYLKEFDRQWKLSIPPA